MSNHRAEGHSFLSNELYNALKYLVTIGLPALGAAYFALGEVLSLPNVAQVVGTIVVITTLLGTLIGVSSKKYNDSLPDDPPVVGMLGSDSVDEDTGIPALQLTITEPPEEFLQGDTVRLRIGTPANPPALK